ncbi:hypothetical protein B0T24DRAFT_428059 [Lasiosphaeria ovina]|uniref:Uncharacterized protein n=1 Tax=Lasiosphaeria ovina TaxID=92902 RepID=A0AAE0JWF1_9PEZI|nr:hypothetical protein B0T24DRAFT_428059 [Lasiosphaeria ovina]
MTGDGIRKRRDGEYEFRGKRQGFFYFRTSFFAACGWIALTILPPLQPFFRFYIYLPIANALFILFVGRAASTVVGTSPILSVFSSLGGLLLCH